MIRILDNHLNKLIFIGVFIYPILFKDIKDENIIIYYMFLSVYFLVWGIYRETYLYKSIQKKRIYIKDTKREFLNNISKFTGYLFLSFSYGLYLLDNPFALNIETNNAIIAILFIIAANYIIIGFYRLERNEFEFNQNHLRIFKKHKMFAKVKHIKDFRILEEQIIIKQEHSYVELKRLDLDSEKRLKIETELTNLKSRIDAKNLEKKQIHNRIKN